MSRDAYEGTLNVAWTDAGHPDQGSLKTWLDEQYDSTVARDVETHVNGCARCQQDVASLRGFEAAASRLLASLDPIGLPTVRPDATRVVPGTARRTATRGIGSVTRIAAALVAVAGLSTWVMLAGRGSERPTAVQATLNVTKSRTVPTDSAPVAAVPVPAKASANASAPATAVQETVVVATAERRGKSPAQAMPAAAPAPEVQGPGVAVASLRADSTSAARATTIVVQGSVRERDSGRALEGASVTILGTTFGALTNSIGQFSITMSRPLVDTIAVRVRRIGYQSLVVAQSIRDTVTLNASLSASATLQMVTIAAEQASTANRRMVASATTISAAPRTADFAGKGVAGGVARGVEQERKAPVRGDIPPSFMPRPGLPPGNREQYDKIDDNPFLAVKGNPRSTFSVDVDRASYGNVRRFINDGGAPPPDAVRIEELLNYFTYDLASPRGNAPVAITTETMSAPWQPKHRLVRIALQARRIDTAKLPPSNLVFLIDVSGSMSTPDKLPLVKASLRLLVDQLREQDRVALVVYAGSAGLVLPSTSGSEKAQIMAALDRLEAGGSTAGGAGLELAYRTAKEHFLANGNNRVILATDGDFNVGQSSDGEMERLIESKRAEGTYLTVLGFGRGNVQDAKMEKLAKRGNGNYAYVDNIAEARKTLIAEMGATLVTVANDVKLQVEFNPDAVSAYRLIGYEDRLLATEDFADDRKDAGDMGAGHSVTALYEVVPAGVTGTVTLREQDALRYAVPVSEPARGRAARDELAYVALRYKKPGESTSVLTGQAVSARANAAPTADFRFAASVASFGMLLRNSEHRGASTMQNVLDMARGARGEDVGGYRAEFIGLVEKLAACQRAERTSCRAPR